MKTRKITLAAIMLATAIILTRFFSIYIPLFNSRALRFDLGYIIIMFAGIVLGPLLGGLVGLLADLIGANLFPVGDFHGGFTLNSFLTAFIPGCIFHAYLMIDKIKKHLTLCYVIFLICLQAIATAGLLLNIDVAVFKDPLIILTPLLATMLIIGCAFYLLTIFVITYLIDKKKNAYCQLSAIICLTVMTVVSLFLSPAWLSQLYNQPYNLYFIARVFLVLPYTIIPIIILATLINVRPKDL